MNHSSLLFFLGATLCCLMACKSEYNNTTAHPLKNTHNYPTSGTAAEESNEEEAIYDSGNRWIWQKPELVIERLGNLDNKTVADIGAGPYGYFSFRIAAQTTAKKVIAADINEEVFNFINDAKKLLPESTRDRLEPRVVKPDNPMLAAGEADVVLIVNTASYFEDRLSYFQNLRKGIASGGKIVIIDFKKRNTA
ncbi:MAG: class I SAM-dependent methyltransferase, partial [Bacteroidota bacterium]